MSNLQRLLLLTCLATTRVAAAATCPADMSIDPGPRRITTSKAPVTRDVAAYKKLKASLVPTHTKAPPAKWGLTAEAAIAAVLAIEAAHPELIPAGFRAEVAARPRDAKLRQRMGECEFRQAPTRRRASYDIAMALLLDDSMAAALNSLLEQTTRHEDGGGTISEPELAIEDAITRALHPRYRAAHGALLPESDAAFFWFMRRLHQCGKQVCGLAQYNAGDKPLELVEWDLRDGGAALPPPQPKPRYRKCFNATGYETLSPCMQYCVDGHRDASCFRNCTDNCGAR